MNEIGKNSFGLADDPANKTNPRISNRMRKRNRHVNIIFFGFAVTHICCSPPFYAVSIAYVARRCLQK